MRTGLDARTGRLLTGWAHCVQSIDKCLRTRYATRVMRRHLGSLVPELQDANANAMTIFAAYRAIAEALDDPHGGEPGFALRTIEMTRYGRDGAFAFILDGDWFPRGHLGDYAVRERRQLAWVPA